MQVKVLQTGDYRAEKQRRVLGQTLCMGLSQYTVWGLDTGLRRGRNPGRYDWIDTGWDWVQKLDRVVDPDMNWD